MSNDMGMEALYAMGTGIASKESLYATSEISEEALDPFADELARSAESAEMDVDFIDTLSAINDKNASDKIKMVSRISHNYGKFNTSVESYCRSLEATAAAEKTDAAAPTDTKAAAPKTSFGAKAKKFFGTIAKAISTFFKKIWEFLKSIPGKISALLTKIFGKKTSGKPTAEEAKANKTAYAADQAKNNYPSAAKQGEVKVRLLKSAQVQENMIKAMDASVKKDSKILDAITSEFDKGNTIKTGSNYSSDTSEGKIVDVNMFAVTMGCKLLARAESFVSKIITKFNSYIRDIAMLCSKNTSVATADAKIKSLGANQFDLSKDISTAGLQNFANMFNKSSAMYEKAFQSAKSSDAVAKNVADGTKEVITFCSKTLGNNKVGAAASGMLNKLIGNGRQMISTKEYSALVDTVAKEGFVMGSGKEMSVEDALTVSRIMGVSLVRNPVSLVQIIGK